MTSHLTDLYLLDPVICRSMLHDRIQQVRKLKSTNINTAPYLSGAVIASKDNAESTNVLLWTFYHQFHWFILDLKPISELKPPDLVI